MITWIKEALGAGWPTFRLGLLCFAVAALGAGAAALMDFGPNNPWSMLVLLVVAGAVVTGGASVLWGMANIGKWPADDAKKRRDAP